jgi:HEXXH motif-containing protein
MTAILAAPRDLTIPEPSSHTARDVLSQALRRLLRDLRGLSALAVRDPVRRDLEQLLKALAQIQKERPGALASALRRPDVGAPLRCLRNPSSSPMELDDVVATFVAACALELARTSALPFEVSQQWLPRRITSSGGRFTLDVPSSARSIVYASGAVTLRGALGEELVRFADGQPLESARVRRTYHVVERDVLLALDDDNPLSMVEAHPGKAGNPIDLGGRPAAEWLASLQDALARIERFLPDLRAELDLFVQQFVPVGWDGERHLSASYREAIGTVYLTLHPSAMTMTEAVIHEFSHNKLNALFEIDDVLENAFSPLYKSPVRPDPRPLHGVLLAVHAFLPVARLYEKMIEADVPEARSEAFRARYRAIARINREGAEVVLAHAKPTPMGTALFEEIARWDAHFRPVAELAAS